ncbi:MAG: pyridoxamine 5'-phosphate oxidase family protein [Candidatus Binatia bacterium]
MSTKPPVSDIAFTPAVKAIQERLGSRAGYAKMERQRGWQNTVTPALAAFIADRDSFYLATASADGRPYIQHRGGPKGFLKVLDEHTLAFADFNGNRQYISMGNLTENNQAFIFLMDYVNKRRIKVWGRAEVIEDDPPLLAQLQDPAYKAQPARVFRFHVEAWDVNCPQHITPRFTAADVGPEVQQLRDRIAELEAEVAALRDREADRRGLTRSPACLV